MRASRQSDFRSVVSRRLSLRSRGALSAFTLIELIFVLALLAIIAVWVTGNMSSFFRGRALSSEARRMLSLTHYAQSRAVSEGVPMILWVNPTDSTYGLAIQSSFTDAEGDLHAVKYSAEPTLILEAPAKVGAATSEQEDERLGVAEGLSFIRFNPDGFADESSVRKIIIHPQGEAGLEVVATANRLGYEIRPASVVN